MTEDDAGTDTSRIRTFARRDGDRWIVNGKKVWNTKAQQAQKILLLDAHDAARGVRAPAWTA